MKEIKNKPLAICAVFLLLSGILVGCKPIFEKKPVEGKEGSKEAAPAAAPAPAPATPTPAPAPAPKAEELQSIDSLPSTTESLDATAAAPVAEAPPAAQLVDDGDEVVKTTPALMKKVQQALVNAGFNPGPVDGVSGGKTVAAIESFQKQQGIPPGKITKRTLRALGIAF